ncbi:hypothetical protein Tco_1418503 [Tanacetum coccineum]
MDKCKTGLGYNVVPPPYTGNFMPPKSDLVYLSLDDFVDVNESVSESVVEKPTIETNEPKTARKENGAPIIEDWVSDSDEENVPKVKTVEMFNKPSFAKINFVKSTEQVKSPRKTSVDKNRQNTPSPRGNKRNWNQQMSQKLGSNFEMFNKACHVCDSEIASLKKKVKKLERRNKSRTLELERLRKFGLARRVESSEVTLINETQGRNDDNLMFDTSVLDEQEVEVKKVVSTVEVTTKKKQEQLSIEEKSKLFVQLLEARKKHFAEIRAREKRNKPLTQAQQRKLYCNYLKNIEGYTLKQLKGFKFEVIKDMFDKPFKRVNTFVDYKTELVEGSEKRADDSTKRAGTEPEQEVAKKQKIDDAKVDDDQEEARMKELMNIVPDEEEVSIDAIPLATMPPCIIDWKIIKEGKISQFQIIRADRSSKRYSVFIQMLRNFDKEDLETLWKLSTLSEVAIYEDLYAGREKLLKLITKQLKNLGSGRIVGIKSFIRLFGITAALIKVSAAQEERVNDAGTKLQLLMDKD